MLAGWLNGSPTYDYNPSTGTWSTDASLLNSDTSSEATWTKLPDGSILTQPLEGNDLQTGQRFVAGATQAQDQWVAAGSVPVPLGSSGGAGIVQEQGPAFLLPDGQVFCIGSSGNTALYSPPALAGNSTGTWVAGPVIPDGEGPEDAPGDMMPNGDVLFAVSPYITLQQVDISTATRSAGGLITINTAPLTNALAPLGPH